MSKLSSFIVLVVTSSLMTGCFNEPEPAYKSVSADCRIYLNDADLENLNKVANDWRDDIDYLNLDRNKLSDVSEVKRFVSLKWLRLNSNNLSSLPDLSSLKSLKRIYLRDNSFSEVPATLKDLPSLDDIDLSGNPISEIPDWLAKKEGLENLSFSRTRIKRLPEDLSAWKSLLSLQLGELELSSEEMARIRAALPDTAVVF